MSEVQRTSIGWTSLPEGVVGGCENEEWARRSMRGSQLAGKDEMADEKTHRQHRHLTQSCTD